MNQKNILYATVLVGALLIGIGVYKMSFSDNTPQIIYTSATTTSNSVNTITVPADKIWTDTGITLKSGQKLTLRASGQINIGSPGDAADKWVGADGWGYIPSKDWRCGNHPCNYVNVSNSLGSLIGKIGKNGKPFAIGSQATFVSTGTGNLYLGVDDSFSDSAGNMLSDNELINQIYYNNRGSFNVSLDVSN